MSDLYIFLMSSFEALKSNDSHRSPYKFIRACKAYKYRLISWLENVLIKKAQLNFRPPKEKKSDKHITASLTTFPARINEVYYAIKSIMLQTVTPDRIVLWLANSQFPEGRLPDKLLALKNHGLEIRYCDDLKAHKKYYYALQEQKNDELVITFDDDIIYHPHTIERLIESHQKNPQNIICSAAHIITLDDTGNIRPYNQWDSVADNTIQTDNRNTPLTGSGCLYPYGIMCKETFNIENIHRLAFSADDLWIGMMAKLSNVNISTPRKVARTFTVVQTSQKEHLGQINCIGDGNDRTIRNLIAEYPELLNKIRQ